MPIVVRRIRLRAAPSRVWPFVEDVQLQLRWMHDLKAVEVQTPGPLRVGTRAVGRVRVFGITARDPIEVDALEPGRHLGLRHLGLFRGRGDIWLEPAGDAAAEETTLTWREELSLDPAELPLPPLPESVDRAIRRLAGRLARAGDRLMAPVLATVFRADLRRLRRLVQGTGGAPLAS